LKKYDYVLPIISNQQYNLRLKIVADYAGLDRNLTVHVARHITFSYPLKTRDLQKMLA